MTTRHIAGAAGALLLLLGTYATGEGTGRRAAQASYAALPSPTPRVIVRTRTITRTITRIETKKVKVSVVRVRTITRTVKVPVIHTVTRTLTRTVTIAAPTAVPTAKPTATVEPADGPATSGGVSVSASNLHYDDGGDYGPPSGQQFLVAHVTLVNNGDRPASYNALDFKIEGADDHQRYGADAFDLNVSNSALSYGKIAPGESVAGDLAFQVPSGDQKWTLLWTPDIFGDSISVGFSD